MTWRGLYGYQRVAARESTIAAAIARDPTGESWTESERAAAEAQAREETADVACGSRGWEYYAAPLEPDHCSRCLSETAPMSDVGPYCDSCRGALGLEPPEREACIGPIGPIDKEPCGGLATYGSQQCERCARVDDACFGVRQKAAKGVA